MSFEGFMGFVNSKTGGSGGSLNQPNTNERADVNALIDFGGVNSNATEEDEYKFLCDIVSRNIFQISNNVSSIQKMTSMFGTDRDTQEVRQNMNQLTESTKQLAKMTNNELKKLSVLANNTGSAEYSQKRAKLTRDFQVVLKRYQEVERIAMEKSKDYVIKAKAINEQKRSEEERLAGGGSNRADYEAMEQESLIQSAQKQSQLKSLEHEINYNENLIAEREEGMKEIETAILEVNEIFRDLGTLVNEQQSLLDNIEANIESSAVRTVDATEQLTQASKSQKSARNKKCFFLMLFTILASIVILVILATK